jgi:hypothetical protein
MANPASDYHRGEMDIHEQVSTFHAFIGMSKWFCLALASVLVFVASFPRRSAVWCCWSSAFSACASVTPPATEPDLSGAPGQAPRPSPR